MKKIYKDFKKTLFCTLFVLISFIGVTAQANTMEMNQTMVRMINQIDAIFPLINQASHQQSKEARVQFHFYSWTDSKGVKHDGLNESLLKIRRALVQQINHSSLTPKEVKPINGDFIGR